MEGLLDSTVDFNEEVQRNIVSLRTSQNLFDDLLDNDDETDILIAAEMRIKNEVEAGAIPRAFHYSTAIEYPFKTEPFMASRYGDGTYPIWYGSLELETTIHETCWHMFKELSGIEGLNESVIRERAIYIVDCHALLFDLVRKKEDFPELIAEHYSLTQQVGKRIQQEGHPGLLAPSARHHNGTNVVLFQQRVVDNPKINCYLTYTYDPVEEHISIEREVGKVYMVVKKEYVSEC